MRKKFNATYDVTEAGVAWQVHDYTKGVIPVAKGVATGWLGASEAVFAAIQQRIGETTPVPEEESESESEVL